MAAKMKIPKRSSWLLFLFGFFFLGWSLLDEVRHMRDTMTFVSIFIGLLAFAAGYCVQNVERRLTSIEEQLRVSQGDRGVQEAPDPEIP